MGMLVLSRKKGERITIGKGVQVCVVEVRGDKVRLGIEAPPDVDVVRNELLDQGPATEGVTGAG